MLKTFPTPNADGSMLVTGGFVVGVGVLATDAQHGNLAGGAGVHADATNLVAGFFTAAQKTELDGLVAGIVSGASFFGDGADGAVTLGTSAVSAPMTRATTFHATGDVTPVAGQNGLVLRALTSIDIDGGASINTDGLGSAGTAGGAAGAAGTNKAAASQTQCFANPALVAGGTAGAAGTNPGGNGGNGGSGNTGNTFQGGTGGGGGGSGGGTATGGAAGGAGGIQGGGSNFDDFRWARVRWDPMMLPSFTNVAATGIFVGIGGTGGGGGGTGGGAGGAGGPGGSAVTATGAGFVYLATPAITGAGRISCNGTVGVVGTNGTASGTQGGGAGGGGSGGGSGGSVAIKTKSLGGGLTVQANGGAGGAGGTGAAGGAGAGTGGNGGTGGTGGAGVVETAILA